MAVVTMRQLLESGVHFGHQTRRWNPKMKRFIMTERNGIYIIDLQQSLAYIDRSYAFIKDTVAKGGTIMFVGTKKQAQEAIAEQATRVGMPYVNQRWLGGMLTNFQTVHLRINRLKELDEIDFEDVAGSSRTKKELLQMRRERDKLNKSLGGIREMSRTPSAVWIVDTNKEHLAVEEARKLHIPIIGILDSNCDPDLVDFPIPGNDDAIRAVGLLTRVVADAVAEGLIARSGVKTGDAPRPRWAPRSRWPSGSASCWAATPSKAAADRHRWRRRRRDARRRGHRRRRRGRRGHRGRAEAAETPLRGRRDAAAAEAPAVEAPATEPAPMGPRPRPPLRARSRPTADGRPTAEPTRRRGRVRRRLRRPARGRLGSRGLRDQGQQELDEVPRPEQPVVRPHQRRGLVPHRRGRGGRRLRQRRDRRRGHRQRDRRGLSRPTPHAAYGAPSARARTAYPEHLRGRSTMANFSASDVKKLRDMTGAGMMDAKKALDEADGDFDAAIDILRTKGAAKAAKRGAEREATAGLVAHSGGALRPAQLRDRLRRQERRLHRRRAADRRRRRPRPSRPTPRPSRPSRSATRPSARSSRAWPITIGEKIELGRVAHFEAPVVGLPAQACRRPPARHRRARRVRRRRGRREGAAKQIAAMRPQYLTRDEVPADVVEHEREIAEATSREEGKPEQAIAKITEGRLNGFFKDVVLLDQPSVTENKKSVQAVLDESGTTVKRFARFEVGA